ncbi:tyrosine-type recombinase/integrase [Bacillus capparidis]|nr:tyrosine-type recombinase/integrase [Bacillus capparidis]MED1097439.1 tyrosine-type recombinase/integrase [Bacillus capparidis]
MLASFTISCSYLLSQGYSMKVIQERLGHKDYQTTMNIYAHVSKKMNQEAGKAFPRIKK